MESTTMAVKPVPNVASRMRAIFTLAVCIVMFLSMASPAAAQKDKKKKKDAAPDPRVLFPIADEQQIDYRISDMLGAWQLGDIDRLHQSYADDAVFVSGIWEPPVFGWSNYLPLYQQQHARTQQVRLDRTNTFIKASGNVAWACYQWDFSGTVDGQPMNARGQTTLVFEKRADHWVIVHNHTSVAQPAPGATTSPQPNAPANTPPPQQPSKPPAS
jgi:ketosteroid isomerase-like protein